MYVSLHFEISGRVTGVFFRKCTKEQADELGLRGWVSNTRLNTVEGVIQGPRDKVDSMKHWLNNTGSPHSIITECRITDEKNIDKLEFDSFTIRKTT